MKGAKSIGNVFNSNLQVEGWPALQLQGFLSFWTTRQRRIKWRETPRHFQFGCRWNGQNGCRHVAMSPVSTLADQGNALCKSRRADGRRHERQVGGDVTDRPCWLKRWKQMSAVRTRRRPVAVKKSSTRFRSTADKSALRWPNTSITVPSICHTGISHSRVCSLQIKNPQKNPWIY